MDIKWLKTQKAQNTLLLVIAVIVVLLFVNGYLSAKNEEDNYLMNKLV